MAKMQRIELLDLANQHYPEQRLSRYYTRDARIAQGHGDTLALWIVIELLHAYRDGENGEGVLLDALDRLEEGVYDVQQVIAGLKKKLASQRFMKGGGNVTVAQKMIEQPTK